MLLKKYSNYNLECGVDEAGRGCLAGPVTAAAVILKSDFNHELINDSKKLNSSLREKLVPIIIENCICFAVKNVSPKKIDEINILNATYQAMNLAIEKLKIKPDKIIIDGNSFKAKKKIDFECIVGGDDKYISIAAASILAKVKRDEIMCKLSAQFPMYDWEKNKGYGTFKHIQMIYKYGPCEYHRMTFRIKNKQLKLTI